MPELPEVETVRRSLQARLLGAVITRAHLLRPDICRVTSATRAGAPGPRHILAGARIAAIERRGKQIAIIADDARTLVVHLGMTGQMLFIPQGQRPPRPDHIHATWSVRAPDDTPLQLLFRDPRRFGELRAYASDTDLRAGDWAALGPDALTIADADLADRLQRTARPIKPALLDQHVLAGVGNIYADEALFEARINPHTPTDRLTPSQAGRLAHAIRAILARAVDAGGSTLRDYTDAEGQRGAAQTLHKAYGRGGQPCVRCKNALVRTTLAQRTTVHCPTCQPATPAQP